MEHYEMRLLADYYHTGVQAANVWVRPTPRAVGGELERDERAEVIYAEIFAPRTGAGDAEVLLKVIPVLDGERQGEYVSLSGIRDSVMMPPKDRMWGAKLLSFGTPMSSNPILSTTLKYSHTITIECLAGGAAVDEDYRIRLWGYVYKETELPTVFGTMVFPAYLTERARARTLTLSKSPIPVNGDTWKTLPGGKDQAIPKIMPFMRYAWNANQTDGMQGDYQFRYELGNVGDADENLWFEFDEKDALLVEGIGVRAPANLQFSGLRIAGDYHPKGLIPTPQSILPETEGLNPLHFGHAYPFFAANIPLFRIIPKLEKPYLIWNEIGMVVVRDDGTIIPAANTGVEPPTGIVVALTGVRIEMHG